MNNNPELGNNNQVNDAANQWGNILPKESFYESRQNSQETPKTELSDEEIKQKIIAEKRIEKLKEKAEAREALNRFAARALAVAIGATALVGGLIATGPKDDFLKSEQARQKVVEMENVEKISFHGNIRSNPKIPNSEDQNTITSINDEVSFAVPDGSTVYYYRDENDPNGGWYGISNELLENESLISKSESRQDGDKTVWINDGNARVATK